MALQGNDNNHNLNPGVRRNEANDNIRFGLYHKVSLVNKGIFNTKGFHSRPFLFANFIQNRRNA